MNVLKNNYSLYLIYILLLILNKSSTAQNQITSDSALQQLLSKVVNAKDDTLRMDIYIDICMYYNEVLFENDSAIVYGEKAKQIAEKFPNHNLTLKVWNGYAATCKLKYLIETDTQRQNFYFKTAEFYYKKCFENAIKLNNENFKIISWYNLTDLYNQSKEKYLYYKNCYELIKYINIKQVYNDLDTIILRNSYFNLCTLLDNQVGSIRFNNYLEQLSKVTPPECSDYDRLLILKLEYYSLSYTEKDENKFLQAYHNFKKNNKINYLNDHAEICLAQYYLFNHQYLKSIEHLNRYAPKLKELNFDKRLYKCYIGLKYLLLGKNYYSLQKYNKAINFLNLSLQNINEVEITMGLENEKYEALDILSKVLEKVENYKQAIYFMNLANAQHVSINDKLILSVIEQGDIEFEKTNFDKILQQSNVQTLLKEQEIEIQKKQKYSILIFSILALLSAAWAVLSFIKTRKQNKTIQKQAVALAESNQLKDKIFALLSHDLRSPINRLVMSLNQSIESQRSAIQSELKGVQDILNNILYWASMQLKGITPINRELPLKALVDSIENEYHVILKDKNITFLNSIDSKLIIKTDENYLKIIIRNLISNAIKFTEQTGYIQIYCKENEDNLEIGLKDTGIGIPAEKLKNIYNYPESSPGTRHETGNGIGLSLSMEIAKKLNGILKINSIEQKGTVVQLILNKKLSS